jgi:hypothetical protein
MAFEPTAIAFIVATMGITTMDMDTATVHTHVGLRSRPGALDPNQAVVAFELEPYKPAFVCRPQPRLRSPCSMTMGLGLGNSEATDVEGDQGIWGPGV